MAARRRWSTLGLVAVLAGCSQSVISPTVHPSTSASTAAPQITAVPSPTELAPTPTASAPALLVDQLAIQPPTGYVQQIHCSRPIGQTDSVALVELKGADPDNGDMVMRDYANPAHPRTVCTFGTDLTYNAQLFDARHALIQACTDHDCAWATVDLPEARYHWFALPKPSDASAELVALSPRLDEIAWISTKPDGTGRQLHITRADGDHVVARLREVLGRCGSPDDSKLGDYTEDGTHLYVLDVPIANDTVFIVLSGVEKEFALRPPPGGWNYPNQPAMPVWTPDGSALYFRSGGHGWRWNASSGREPFAPADGWRFPTISPDGRHVAWAKPRDDGFHDLYLLDLTGADPPQRIVRKATTPVFLNDRQLWYVTEGRGVCGTGADEKRVYDLSPGTSSPSIIVNVYAVWPATSAIY